MLIQLGFSKTYDDSFNPQSAFAAILTCSQADGACPLLVLKKNTTFEDPKHLIIHPTRRKIERASKSLRAFLCILKKKKIICPQLIALLP
jgi:hypothetical protein